MNTSFSVELLWPLDGNIWLSLFPSFCFFGESLFPLYKYKDKMVDMASTGGFSSILLGMWSSNSSSSSSRSLMYSCDELVAFTYNYYCQVNETRMCAHFAGLHASI